MLVVVKLYDRYPKMGKDPIQMPLTSVPNLFLKLGPQVLALRPTLCGALCSVTPGQLLGKLECRGWFLLPQQTFQLKPTWSLKWAATP